MLESGGSPPDVVAHGELVDALAGELEAHQRVALEQLADETDAAWAAWLNGTTPYAPRHEHPS